MHSEVTNDRTALRDLRRTRKLRRLGDTEWFDVAYRVYLFALVGLTAVVIVSDTIDGLLGDDVTTADLLERGPSVLGLIVVAAFGMGLRSGADGGPISIEVADIEYVLLAPIDRRRALLRPIGQRIRSMMFSLGLAVGVLGQLVASEVDGSRAAWAGAGALFGGVVGAVFVSSAVISHAIRLPRWVATAVGAFMLAWQGVAAWVTWDGPADSALRFGPATLDGSLAFWGIRQRGIDVAPLIVVLVAIGVALCLGNALRIEPLARRGALVSQLRFAATVQDLRTVVMLRRQLRAETLRSTPWARRTLIPLGERAAGSRPVPLRPMIWRRGLRSIRRLPAARLGRIVSLAVIGGVCASFAVTSSPLFFIGVLAALFLLGMESIEPLSQEIDRPDITDSLPIARGELYVHHLVAPGVLLVAAGVIGACAATVVDPAHAAGAFAIAIPTAWAGAIGPVVGAVLDSPTPIAVADTTILGAPRNRETTLVPPEFAGFSNAFSTLMPVILSAVGLLPIVAMRFDASVGMAARSALGAGLMIGAVVLWILRRDRWGVRVRAFFKAGREQKAAA